MLTPSDYVIILIVIIIIIFILYYVQETPQLNTIDVNWHKSLSDTTASAVLFIHNEECLFVAGGYDQPDVILQYDYIKKSMEIAHYFAKYNNDLTYAVAVAQLKNRDDLIIARKSGVYIYYQNTHGFDCPLQIYKFNPTEQPCDISIGYINNVLSILVATTHQVLLLMQENNTFVNYASSKNIASKGRFKIARFINLDNTPQPSIITVNDTINIYKYINDQYICVPMPIIRNIISISYHYISDIPSLLITTNRDQVYLKATGDYEYDVIELLNLNGSEDAIVHDYTLTRQFSILFATEYVSKTITEYLSAFEFNAINNKSIDTSFNNAKGSALLTADLTGNGIHDIIYLRKNNEPTIVKTKGGNFINVILPKTKKYAHSLLEFEHSEGTEFYQLTLDNKSSMIQFGLGNALPISLKINEELIENLEINGVYRFN